jgi:Xaa-Pro aminopeptidase
MVKAGVPACDVAKFHLEKVKEYGYEDHYLYGPFHGNGLMEGEAPWVEVSSDYLLEESMTFCSDLFLGSHETKRGIRIEDVVRITKDGVENLTSYPLTLFEIDR